MFTSQQLLNQRSRRNFIMQRGPFFIFSPAGHVTPRCVCDSGTKTEKGPMNARQRTKGETTPRREEKTRILFWIYLLFFSRIHLERTDSKQTILMLLLSSLATRSSIRPTRTPSVYRSGLNRRNSGPQPISTSQLASYLICLSTCNFAYLRSEILSFRTNCT